MTNFIEIPLRILHPTTINLSCIHHKAIKICLLKEFLLRFFLLAVLRRLHLASASFIMAEIIDLDLHL